MFTYPWRRCARGAMYRAYAMHAAPLPVEPKSHKNALAVDDGGVLGLAVV